MNNLQQIWEKQKSFQLNFFDPENISEEERIKLTKEYILSVHRELGEILNVIPWKLHRANTKEYNKEHVQEEIIDTFKFLLNICILQGLTPESFEELFYKKSEIVEKRYADEMGENNKQLKLPFIENA